MLNDHSQKTLLALSMIHECGSDEKLTVKDYLGNIRPYLQDIIDDLKTFGV